LFGPLVTGYRRFPAALRLVIVEKSVHVLLSVSIRIVSVTYGNAAN